MKRIIISIFSLFTLFAPVISNGQHSMGSYLKFLEKNQVTGADYVIELFQKYDIVVLCERDHAEVTQYKLITDIISDSRFISQVGNICVEIGGCNWASEYDKLLLSPIPANENELNEKIYNLQRKISFYPLWNNYSYFIFLSALCEINRDMPNENKIRVYPLDTAFDWAQISSRAQFDQWSTNADRDRTMADNFLAYYRQLPKDKKKVLVIENHMHAFANYDSISKEGYKNFMYYLQQCDQLRIANVFIHNFSSNEIGSKNRLIQRGRWDAAFKKNGSACLGFDLGGSPFADDSFDYIIGAGRRLKYRDVFTGMVYLPLDQCRYVWGNPGIITDEFMPEINRRHKILGYPQQADTILDWYNTFLEEGPNDVYKRFDKKIQRLIRRCSEF